MSGSQYLYIIGISPSPSGHPGNPSWFVGPSLEVSWHGASPTSSELSSTCRCIQAFFGSSIYHGLIMVYPLGGSCQSWRARFCSWVPLAPGGSLSSKTFTFIPADIAVSRTDMLAFHSWTTARSIQETWRDCFFKIQTTIKACKNMCFVGFRFYNLNRSEIHP